MSGDAIPANQYEACQQPVSLREMRLVADAEAARIEATETAWAEVGDRCRPAPLPGQLRRAMVFRRICWMIDVIAADTKLLDMLKKSVGQQRAKPR